MTDGSAVTLPTVAYLGRDFIPAFTSAWQLLRSRERQSLERQSPEPRPFPLAGPDPGCGASGGDQGEPDVPHLVVPAAELARRLPGSLGIALNPGARQSVPVYPDGVAYVASARPAGQPSQAGPGRRRLPAAGCGAAGPAGRDRGPAEPAARGP